jgi:hypothetical protein
MKIIRLKWSKFRILSAGQTESWLDEGEPLNCSVVNEGPKRSGLIALGLNEHIPVALWALQIARGV